ncbi:MAG: ABC transporter ATP-binding protein [Caldilineaceae bacterium]
MMQNHEAEPELPGSSSGSAPLLVAEEIRKSYGSGLALRKLSFSLYAGHILGFLGPNGAGKTTAIRILTTILEPSSGHFTIDGISSRYPQEIRRRIGVLPESLGFAKHMTGLECLTFFGQLYGQPASQAKKRGMELLRDVGLEHKARALIGSYSRGMRQRLGIARSLVNNPAVVFFDEPTLGLDPRGQQELLGLVRWVARERKTGVVLCSHALNEIEDICDDVVILRDGEIIAQGTVRDVIKRAQSNIIRIHVPETTTHTARTVLEALPEIVKVTPTTKGWLLVELANTVERGEEASQALKAEILNALVHANVPVQSFEAESGRLQDVFFQLTEGAAQ